MADKRSANQYDKIFRENIEPLFLSFVERSLGLQISKKEALLDKIVSTTTREMDSLYKIETKDGMEFILHLEVQSKDNPEMIYRVSEYHALALRKYKLPIKHIVVYLGEKKSSMQTSLPTKMVFTDFELLSLHNLNTKNLLNSNVAEEVLLAILSNYEKTESGKVIQSILLRLQNLCSDKKQLKKFTSQLTILSKLRNLEDQTVTKIKDMTQLFDIRTSILFKEGLEQGLEQGEHRGELKKQLVMIANMLVSTDLSIEQIASLAEVEIFFILMIKEKLKMGSWNHPDTWEDEQWLLYFEDNHNDFNSNEDMKNLS